MTTTAPRAAEARVRKIVPLRELGIAPENMRYGEPPDGDIAQLALTIKAAGVLSPLTVRPGRRKEKRFMALDGRRRLLALAVLLEAGDIDDGYELEVYEETEAGRQAAAVLLTNTAVPVHVADVIASIGKMLKSKLTAPVIAAALGYGEAEVKRLAALSGLHPTALAALKQGKLSLKQARLLARLPDTKLQAELAKTALAGLGFQEWRVHELLNDSRITSLDRRFPLVGTERYAAAGGRTEADLFGELPDVLLDPAILQALWAERLSSLVRALEAEGLAVHLAGEDAVELSEALEPLGYVYAQALSAEQLEAYDAARSAYHSGAERVRGADLDGEEGPQLVAELVMSKLAMERAGQPGRKIEAAVLCPAAALGADARFYAAPLSAVEEEDEEAADGEGGSWPEQGAPAVDCVDTEGVTHALHETRTDMATRGLIRAVADDPAAAVVALTARLFTVLVLERAHSPDCAALAITAKPYSRRGQDPVEALDGDVRRRLTERRSAFAESGLRPIPWIAGLPHGERMALLAELTAVSLDLRELRTDALRRAARADAEEIAGLASAAITALWTPDEGFLKAHTRKQLLDMLDDMGAQEDGAKVLKKDELVALVAARAAERAWAPACLSWTAAAGGDSGTDTPDGEEVAQAA